MSVALFLEDVVTGDESDALKRLKDWWAGASPLVKKFVSDMETDEGQILEGLVVTGAQDVISGGLTTASFTATAADIESKLISQNIALAKTQIYAALNTAVSLASPATAS